MKRNGSINKNGYVVICINYKKIYKHRYVYEKHYGPIPPGMCVIHKNGIKTDNRISNLMLVTNTEAKRFSNPNYTLINGIWHKKCHRCGKTFTLNQFRNNKGYYNNLCKKCEAKYNAKFSRRLAKKQGEI